MANLGVAVRDDEGQATFGEVVPHGQPGLPPANDEDRRLIRHMAQLAVACGLKGEPGIIGHDEGRDGALRAIEFSRIKGGKKFDTGAEWFSSMVAEIGQPVGGPPCV